MAHYEIRVKGHLGPPLAGLFPSMTVVNEPGGEAVLSGPVADQAELRGLLLRVFDLGLVLVAVAARASG